MRRIAQVFASPAMVIALIALIVAVGGTSYAVTKPPKNSVGTAQLRKGAVTTPKLATTAAARIAGLTYRKVTITVPAGTGGVMTVPTPSGLTAISGGVETPHTLNTFMLDSHPTATGWEMSLGNAGDAPETVTAYVVAAKAEGGAAKASVRATKASVRWFRYDR